jgi:hypothetical protein
MRRIATLVVGVLLVACGTALAQDRAEVSVGWRHLYIAGSDGEAGANVPKGWYADIAVPFTGRFLAVAEAAGHYESETAPPDLVPGVNITGTADAKIHTFLGGVRVRGGASPRVSPFAQVLFGVARASASAEGNVTVGGTTVPFDFSESESEAALSVGGGVNVSAGSLGVRIQAEWLKILADDSGNAFRVGIGLVIPF